MGYARGIRLTVNLVGTKQTYLLDFAQGAGIEEKRWADPLNGMGSGIDRIVCNDPNLMMPFQVAVANLNETEVNRIIVEIAMKLGRAFNHQSEPRCFNYGTRDYPWNEYSPHSY
jgi:hypothetical protein